METNNVVDALPYIDFEYDESNMKEAVMAMVDEEKKRYRPLKNYLEKLAPLELHRFETELLRKEQERITQRVTMEVLSMKRYELPNPPPGKLTDIQAWTECVQNSYSQLEHQQIRLNNLELMVGGCGNEAWKNYLQILNAMTEKLLSQVALLKRDVQEINWDRKSRQQHTGEELKQLEHSWVALVSKNYEIESACIDLNNKINKFKQTVAM